MQSLVLHPPSLTTSQFGPRFNSDPERLLNRSWSPNGHSPRAPLPRQSMSGSPPEEPSEPSAEKPLHSTDRSGPVLAQDLSHVPQPLPRLPYEQGPVYSGSPRLPGAPYPLPALETTPTAARSLAQKSTRRTKAHVASACVNCKKKHLGCDPARPCRRCVLAGKASTCVDVTHKKRGRPPLKAEDSSLRSYTTHLENPAIPAEAQPAMQTRRTAMHRATSSRELRPMTDLQGLDASPARTPHRWSASVFPLTRPMDPSPIPGVSRRPFSSSGQTHSAPTHPPPAYFPMAGGFNPALKVSTMTGMERRFPTYGVPALPPPTSPPQHQPPPVGVPYLPYTESPSSATRPPISDPRAPQTVSPRDSYSIESPVRLPPIHQATAEPGPPPPPHHVHRLSDPYPTSWAIPGRDESLYEPRPIPLHRSAGPTFNYSLPHQQTHTHAYPHQRSTSNASSMDPIPRHLGPVELPSPIQMAAGVSPSMPRAEAAPSEPEGAENRPVKRRKMALDDMVNG
ncbi:hypothetical protein N7467_001013 [Penicillium canescens]|nr:hypothetical protein N7467_001013 [Penicillium canescens]